MPEIVQQRPARPQPLREQALPRLRALTAALTTAGLTATLEQPEGSEVYVRVINPAATDYRDRITCQHHIIDGYALWFVHSWGEPISPACDIAAAVADISAMLQPRPGAHRAQP
ncbi:MAG: hypothetical protein JWN00_8 [Actinomycetia bacterium]|nr:hypothetical protein [Actinomycetes bacterium]